MVSCFKCLAMTNRILYTRELWVNFKTCQCPELEILYKTKKNVLVWYIFVWKYPWCTKIQIIHNHAHECSMYTSFYVVKLYTVRLTRCVVKLWWHGHMWTCWFCSKFIKNINDFFLYSPSRWCSFLSYHCLFLLW
jgi:hypothetical protein